jgi:hypothetical protein
MRRTAVDAQRERHVADLPHRASTSASRSRPAVRDPLRAPPRSPAGLAAALPTYLTDPRGDQHDQRNKRPNTKYASDQSTHNLQKTWEAEATGPSPLDR